MSSLLSAFRCATLALSLGAVLLAPLRAQPAPPAPDAAAVLSGKSDDLMSRCMKKAEAGQRSEAEFAGELKELDALVAQYGNDKSDDAVRLRLTQAMIYQRVFGRTSKAAALLEQLKKDQPRSTFANQIDAQLQFLHQQLAAEKTKTALLGKPAPGMKFIWSNRAGLKSLAALKGKVVVLDFWATWSKPCVATFPALRELVAHYQNTDVVVLGVTSLQGRVDGLPGGGVDCTDNPDNEKRLLGIFARVDEMTWPVVLTEEPVLNPRFGVTAILHLAIIAPDGTVRHNGLNPDAPLAEKTALIDAILKEFKLRVP